MTQKHIYLPTSDKVPEELTSVPPDGFLTLNMENGEFPYHLWGWTKWPEGTLVPYLTKHKTSQDRDIFVAEAKLNNKLF